MPSKTVSFSDEAYAQVVQTQPESLNFSEWVEGLMLTGLFIQQKVDCSHVRFNEMSQSDKAEIIDELVHDLEDSIPNNTADNNQ